MLWAAETRVNCIKDMQIVKLLKESGSIQLDFGVETGSPRLLKAIKKQIVLEDTIQAFDLCRKNGIRTFANMLVNLPGEEAEDLNLTHKLLAEIKPTYTSVGVTQPYPGTEMYINLGKPISNKDYHKLSRLIPPEEFRMSKHKISLRELLFTWQLKYKIEPFFERSLFKTDKTYWLRIINSKNRWSYILFLIKEIVKMPLIHVKIRMRYLKGRKLDKQLERVS